MCRKMNRQAFLYNEGLFFQFDLSASFTQIGSINQGILVVIVKFPAIFTHGFCDGFPSFFSWQSWNDMSGEFESLYCVGCPHDKYSTDGGEF